MKTVTIPLSELESVQADLHPQKKIIDALADAVIELLRQNLKVKSRVVTGFAPVERIKLARCRKR